MFFLSRLKELNETHRKVEHEIKIAVFTLINEINKKGKSLLQQLEVREYYSKSVWPYGAAKPLIHETRFCRMFS